MTKRQVKQAYLKADIGLPDAIPALVFGHGMSFGEGVRLSRPLKKSGDKARAQYGCCCRAGGCIRT